MEEPELVNRCKLGDNFARKKLYEVYSHRMMGICYRYTGCRVVSEDLLHDGFIKVFMSIGSFEYRGEGSLKAWLSRIFTNIALEYLRKNEILRTTISIEECSEFDGKMENEEDLEPVPNTVLMDFITELPTGYRTIFNLYTFEEMSHKEISGIMEINEGSSRSQLSRAKAILVKKIKHYIEING